MENKLTSEEKSGNGSGERGGEHQPGRHNSHTESHQLPANRPSRPKISGEYLKLIRIKYQWSQQQLADYLGVDRVTVTRWQNGKRKPMPFLARELYKLGEKR